MTFLFLLLYNYIHTKEVIKIIYFNNHDIILKEKEKINDLISIQQNFSKLLLGYIEKIMDNNNSVSFISSDKMLMSLNHLKEALQCCNKNISILKYLLLLLNNKVFDFNNLKEFNEIARDDSTALVLMGHGTDHPANATYPALDYRLKAEGCRNFFIGTVEGYPDLQTVMKEVAAIHAKKVVLAPLMVVAGDHAINDMCTDEDSWLHLFEQAGYQTEAILKGLGEYLSFRQIYLKHCTECIQHLEEEKSKNR